MPFVREPIGHNGTNMHANKLTASSSPGCGPACPNSAEVQVEVLSHVGTDEAERRYQALCENLDNSVVWYDPRWLHVVCRGLRHKPYLIVAKQGERTVGILPLALVKSLLFGRFLVSLPYVNSAGVIAENSTVARQLIEQAVLLARELNVRHLELRHETELDHASLNESLTTKVHMRLPLSPTVDELHKQIPSKARNQVRKGGRQGFVTAWGQDELLSEFYNVFSRNMRDLGTPVFGRELFHEILNEFGEEAEFCVLRAEKRPVAAALLVHGNGITMVPSASSLRSFNSKNANDWMYWQLLQRAVARGQGAFDFGRTTIGSNTFTFKKKWGAQPSPAAWQYYVRQGSVSDMRPENSKYARAVRMWQKLPVPVTRLIGPSIVRGIP